MQATIADVPPLNSFINLCYVGESSSEGWTTVSDLIGGLRITEQRLQGIISNPNVTLFYIKSDSTEELMASCIARKQNSLMFSEMLCVSSAYQNKGLGRLLLHRVDVLAQELNCSKHVIEVFSCRESVIEWYSRMGFAKNGKVAKFPEPEERDWFPKMELELMEMEKKL